MKKTPVVKPPEIPEGTSPEETVEIILRDYDRIQRSLNNIRKEAKTLGEGLEKESKESLITEIKRLSETVVELVEICEAAYDHIRVVTIVNRVAEKEEKQQ